MGCGRADQENKLEAGSRWKTDRESFLDRGRRGEVGQSVFDRRPPKQIQFKTTWQKIFRRLWIQLWNWKEKNEGAQGVGCQGRPEPFSNPWGSSKAHQLPRLEKVYSAMRHHSFDGKSSPVSHPVPAKPRPAEQTAGACQRL